MCARQFHRHTNHKYLRLILSLSRLTVQCSDAISSSYTTNFFRDMTLPFDYFDLRTKRQLFTRSFYQRNQYTEFLAIFNNVRTLLSKTHTPVNFDIDSFPTFPLLYQRQGKCSMTSLSVRVWLHTVTSHKTVENAPHVVSWRHVLYITWMSDAKSFDASI